MRSKKIAIFLIMMIAALLAGYFAYSSSRSDKSVSVEQSTSPTMQSAEPTEISIDNRAAFAIFTQGTIRIFTEAKYHNRSADVFMTSDEPGIVQVKKPGVTWLQFFDTLPSPMKVSKECLLTGTGQSFCNNNTNTLKFYINGELKDDVLSMPIQDGDKLLMSYGPANTNISAQQARIPSPE